MGLADILVRLGADDQLTAAVEGAAGRVESAGKRMAAAGDRLSARVTAPIVGVGAAALGAVVRVGNLADELLDLEQMTGLSTDALQEWRHVATVAGVAPDIMSKAAEGLTRRLRAAGPESATFADNMAALGVSTRDGSGELREMDTLLPEIIDNLQGVESITERNALAMQIFGRQGSELAPILGLASDEIEGARQAAHDLGLVLERDNLEQANDFRIQWDTLKTVLGAGASQIGVELVPAMSALAAMLTNHVVPGVQRAGEIAAALSTRWQELNPETRAFLATTTGVVAALGPFLSIGGRVIAMLVGLNPVTLAVVAALGAVVAAGVAITENWDVLAFEGARLRDAVTGFVGAMVDGVRGHIDRLLGIFDAVQAGTERVVGFFGGMFSEVVGNSIVPDLVNGVGGEFARLDEVMVGAAERAAARTNQAFEGIRDPDALRSLDFNVSMDASTLYADVIAGSQAAGERLLTLATGTELAEQLQSEFSGSLTENIRQATALVRESERREQAEARLRQQQERLAQVTGQAAIPTREVDLQMQDLATTAGGIVVPALTGVGETADTVSSGQGRLSGVLDTARGVVSGAGSQLGGALSTLGGGALDVLGKLTPMGFAADVVGKVFQELEPAIDALEPIITIVARALAAGLTPIIRALFPVFRLTAIAATFVGEVFFRVAQGIATAVGFAVRAIGQAIDAIPFVSAQGLIRAGESLLDTADGFGQAASDLGDARGELRDLEWPAGEAAVDASTDATERNTAVAEDGVEATRAAEVAIREETGVLTSMLGVLEDIRTELRSLGGGGAALQPAGTATTVAAGGEGQGVDEALAGSLERARRLVEGDRTLGRI